MKFIIFCLNRNFLLDILIQGLCTITGWVGTNPTSVPQSLCTKLRTQIRKHKGKKYEAVLQAKAETQLRCIRG